MKDDDNKVKNNPPRHGRPGMTIEKPKNFWSTVKKIIISLDSYKKWVLVALIFAIISTIFNIQGPKIIGNSMQIIFEGIVKKLNNSGGIDFNLLRSTLLSVLIIWIISAFCQYIQSFIMSTITQKYTYKIRKRIEDKIHKLPFKYFDSKKHGEVLSIVTNDVDTLHMSFNQAITTFVTSITTIIGVLIMMLSINVTMTFIALLIVPLSGLFTLFVIKKSQKYFKLNQDYLGHVNGNVEEMFAGHNIIKAFNSEDIMHDYFQKNNKELRHAGFMSNFLSGLMHPIMQFIGNLGYVFIVILGGYYAIKGYITVGNIQSFTSYVRRFNEPISELAQVLNQLQSMVAASERIFNFLDEDEEVFAKNKLDIKNVKGNIEFKHVKFGYDKDDIIIPDFNIKVKAGEKVAIVGPTGAGKTTIVKLLMHFYDINGGSILLDGHDINEYDAHSLRKVFGMVLQDTWLYSGSIMDNLRYGRLDATDDEVISSAKIANADTFIESLQNGYQDEIDEGTTNISAGQKQLLTIARAIVANSKIMILDEATSSVDTRTEELIQDAMDKLVDGRTSFIIAHRLSTIINADKILVMKDGNIIETGTHEELLKKNGFYASLYNSQFQID